MLGLAVLKFWNDTQSSKIEHEIKRKSIERRKAALKEKENSKEKDSQSSLQ